MLDNIKIFIKLVDIGSITQLANMLNLDRTTIRRKIRDLEKSLNVVLIKDESKRFEITEDGQKFYEHFKVSTQTIINTWQRVAENFNDLHGTLHLSISSENIKLILLEHLPKFLAQYPDVKVCISFTPESSQVNLINQRFDIAISSVNILSQAYQVNKLYTFKYKLFTSSKYVNKYGIPKLIKDLSNHRVVGNLSYVHNEVINYIVEENGFNDSLSINSNLYIDSAINNAIDITKSGEYLAYAWEGAVLSEINTGMLLPVLPEYTFNHVPYYLIMRAENNSKLEVTFANFVEDIFHNLK